MKNLNFKIIISSLVKLDRVTYKFIDEFIIKLSKRRSNSLIVRIIVILIAISTLFDSNTSQAIAQRANPVTAAENPFAGTQIEKSLNSFFDNFNIEDGAVGALVDELPLSAGFRSAFRIKPLSKRDFKGEEPTTVVIDTGNVADLTFKLQDAKGEIVKADIEVVSDQDPVVVKVHPPHQYRPGKYKISVTNSQGEVSSQDFTWGVLAINPDRSIFTPDQTAFFSLAVLNDTGDMVCNADMVLKITDPTGATAALTSASGQIIMNPECFKKEYTTIPDYQTTYKVGGVGVYNLELSATTPSGTRTIADSIEVRNEVPFDVVRAGPTRIYPPITYPVSLTIKANQDFTGTVTEVVPRSFKILQSESVVEFDSIETRNEEDANKSVLGASIFGMGLPYEGNFPITLGFGRQHRDPTLFAKYTQFGVLGHDGADFALPAGSEVVATDTGVVVMAEKNGPYGYTVVIQHSWGKSYYGHLSEFKVKVGDKASKGDLIALSGSTGLSSGPHLHFSIKPERNDFTNGYFGKVDPLPFLGLRDPGINSGQVAGVATSATAEKKQGVQIIKWKVSVKKGETVNLGYKFDAPQISPELYLTGPLEMIDQSGANIFTEARQWQIAADSIVVQSTSGTMTTSVIVSGGIDSGGLETQFGGLQRKVVYVSSAWYAFYACDATTCSTGTSGQIFYKKSTDGITWGSAVAVDTSDSDNHNPSIGISSTTIIACWIDATGTIECKGLATASDTLTGVCASGNLGTIGSTNMVSVAAYATTSAVVGMTDTNGDTEVEIFDVTSITGGTCTPTYTDVTPGNITFGSGLTAGDRPVLATLSSTRVGMVFQDGNLSYSEYITTEDEWVINNLTIASVTDNIYAIASNQAATPRMWVLTANISDATDTNFYTLDNKNGNSDFAETVVDSDSGANDQDGTSDIDMFCVAADDCKFVYTDNQDVTNTPVLMFIDCNNASCSSSTAVTLDSDCGDENIACNPAIHCSSGTDCHIVYFDQTTAAAPDAVFIDCDGADNTNACSTNAAVIKNSDLGTSASRSHFDIDCPTGDNCKFIYALDSGNGINFVDCADDECSGAAAGTEVVDFGTSATPPNAAIDCPSSTTCKVVVHDVDLSSGSVVLVDCSTAGTPETCATPPAADSIQASVGATAEGVDVDIDCLSDGTDCKIIYTDDTNDDIYFVDCNDTDCDTPTTETVIDSNGGAGPTVEPNVAINCISATDCKVLYSGALTTDAEQLYFVDCDNAGCTTGSVIDTPGPRFRGSVHCAGTSTDCKLVYYEGTASTAPAVVFADCDTTNCFPAVTNDTDPWETGGGTAGSNIETVSLTYDSSNTDLYAHIIQDASDQAYYKTSDSTTVSWGSQTSYGFTAGTLNQINSPEIHAGQPMVVLNQGSNYEAAIFVAGVGIAETDVQFGGLQRKVAYVNGNWYAFYADAGDVWYKKSSNGLTWGSAVEVDSTATDTDNYNPTIWVEGNLIYVGWIDDGDDQVELNQFDTSNSDSAGTMCNLTSLGAISNTQLVSVAVTDNLTVYVAQSDTNGGTIDGVQKLVYSGCTTTDISTGSGVADGDRPVLVTQGNSLVAVFQDGQLSQSIYDGTTWAVQNKTIASVADNIFSVVTNQDGKVYVLSDAAADTTNTNFYYMATPVIWDLDTNQGTGTSAIDMHCPTKDNCKIIYHDSDNSPYDLVFLDCNDAQCTSPTSILIDSDTGTASSSDPAIYCPTSDNCKISYHDRGLSDIIFIDCGDETCSGTSGTCNSGTRTCTTIDTDVGAGAAASDVYCPASNDCKVVYGDSGDFDYTFVDCDDETCSGPPAQVDILNESSNNRGTIRVDCPTTDNCKVFYIQFTSVSTVVFYDCADENCSTSSGSTTIDTSVHTNSGVSGNLSCPASDNCKIAYRNREGEQIAFADCDNETCSTTANDCNTPTDKCRYIDTSSGPAADTSSGVDIDCPTSTTCKVVFNDIAAGVGDVIFADCTDETCSATNCDSFTNCASIEENTGTTVAKQLRVSCPSNGSPSASEDCKVLFHHDTDDDLVFADCASSVCFSISSLTAPWTSQTNVSSVSLTYDVSNNNLYSTIIKNTSELAYWKSSPTSSISWSSEKDIGFIPGDLGHISTPMMASSSATLNANKQIGAVLRQSSNFEFNVFGVPINLDLMRHGKWFINGLEQAFTF